MSKWLLLSITDLRNILREQFLWMMLIVAPILQFLMARYGVPWLTLQFPILSDYSVLIAIFLTVQVCSGIGFVVASIMLDEKDEALLTAIRTLPVSANSFLLFRLFGTTMITFLFAWAMIYAGGLTNYGLPASIAVAFLLALIAPTVTLLMATFARNKVEGLAAFKGINLVLLLPVISFFVVPPLKYLFAIIPMYWSFQYMNALDEGIPAMGFLSIALLAHLATLGWLFKLFRKRVF